MRALLDGVKLATEDDEPGHLSAGSFKCFEASLACGKEDHDTRTSVVRVNVNASINVKDID